MNINYFAIVVVRSQINVHKKISLLRLKLCREFHADELALAITVEE